MSLAAAWRGTALAALLAGAACFAGCGGKVVLDGSTGSTGSTSSTGGAGGAVGSSGFPGNGGSFGSSSSGGVECSGTFATLEAAISAAQACSPMSFDDPCTGGVTVDDDCGCPQVVAVTDMNAISAAQSALEQCEALGCCGPGAHPITPPTCGKCIEPASGTCDPQTNRCVPVVGG